MSSRSFCDTHTACVDGFTATPTALRSPLENTRPLDPSSLNRRTAARSESVSTQRLHDDPTLTYIALSAPKTIVRVAWPPPGRLFTDTGDPIAVPVASSCTRTTPFVFPT